MLINLDEIDSRFSKKKKQPVVLADNNTSNQYFIIKAKEKLEPYFGSLVQNTTYHFATAGRWSQFELMHFILSQTGPAKIYFSTWKINEFVASNLFHLVNSGIITEMYAILEKRIPVTSPKAKDLVEANCVKIHICDNHSKVIVIENEDWNVVINGSANMTINPRIESGIVSTIKEVANFHKSWILNEIINHGTFKN